MTGAETTINVMTGRDQYKWVYSSNSGLVPAWKRQRTKGLTQFWLATHPFVWRTVRPVLSLTDYFTDFLKSSFLSEINIHGIVLAADSENLGLNIEIRLKNRQTGKF